MKEREVMPRCTPAQMPQCVLHGFGSAQCPEHLMTKPGYAYKETWVDESF